jgi:Type IV secretory system Conjugative DNA transfer
MASSAASLLAEVLALCYAASNRLRASTLLGRFIALWDRSPRLAAFRQRYPRLALVAMYWLASIPVALTVLVVRASGGLGTAIVSGQWLWLAQACLWLLFWSMVGAPLVPPLVLLALVSQLLGILLGPFVLLGLAYIGFNLIVRLLHPVAETYRQAAEHARTQGRYQDVEVRQQLALPTTRASAGGVDVGVGGIPLGYIKGQPIGLPWTADTGHVSVVGPTRSGKGLHLTDTLLRWPGPAVCVDPKGEQWQRTAGFRQAAFGPVFRIPPQGLDLGQLYDLHQDLDLRELHETLLRPWQDGHDRIFADKALALFNAAVQCAATTGEHPLQTLGRWAQASPVTALEEAHNLAPAPVLVFTDGVEPARVSQNRFALSSWGNFSTRYSPFSAHLPTITASTVPFDWAARNATVYLTYPLQAQSAVGPLAAALVAGLVRRLLASPPDRRVLFAIDEMPTVGLPNLTSYLATVGGAGITLVLYAQALPQIEDVYGHEAALSILSNCTSQLFFPPRESHTAELVSRALGSRLEPTVNASMGGEATYGSRYRPELEPAQVMSLPEGRAVMFSRGLRHIVDDSRVETKRLLPLLPSPPTVEQPTEEISALRAATAEPPRRYW